MRIAFVSANREMLPDACIPLGLLYVLAATPSHHEKKLIDLAFAEDVNDLIADELQKFRPELVAIGIRNIQNNDYSGVSTNLEPLKSLMAEIRAHTNAPIVLGGAGFSVMPAALMKVLGADYGIAGEGEKLFPMLLECIEQGKPPPAGVFAKSKAGQNRDPVVKSFLDLDQLTLPDRSLIDRKYYSLYGTDSIQTSRGCPLHCSYCTYPIIEGSSLRLMDPKRVGDEFEQSAALGAQHVFIVDSVFNMPAVHAKSICRELITRDNPMPWTCYVNPLSFDDELAELMVQAGCVGMEVGSDSGCDDVLRSLRKGFTTAHIRQLHARAQDVGIADCHTFILGTEGETNVLVGYHDKFFGWPGAYTGFASLPETDHTKLGLIVVDHRQLAEQGWWELGAAYRWLEDDYDFDRRTVESGTPGSFEHETRCFSLGLMGETLRVSTSAGGPMTSAMRTANCTSAAVCTPGPWTGFLVCDRV